MKQLFAIILAVLLVLKVSAQQNPIHFSQAQLDSLQISDSLVSFDQATESLITQMAVASPSDTTEGGDLNSFRRWVDFTRTRICTDAPQGENRIAPASIALQYYMKNRSLYCDNSNGDMGNWKNIGPFVNSYGNNRETSGRIECLWVKPGHPEFILAGSNSGGLWKTTNK